MLLPVTLLASSLLLQDAAAVRPSADVVGEAYFLFLQGREEDERDDVAAAIASYKKAIALLPKSADLHAELAGVYARQGQITEARTEAEQALAIDPDTPEAHRVIGWVEASLIGRMAEGQEGTLLREAIGHLETALSQGADDPSSELALGQLYVRNKQYAKAVTTLQNFLAEHPSYPQALQLLADAYDGSGDAASAATTRDALRRSLPDVTASSASGPASTIEALEDNGQWKEAASAWAALVRQNPSNMAYRARYAAALANSADLAGARGVLQDALRTSPKEVSLWYLLVQVEARAGNGAAAEDAAKKIGEIDAADPRGPLALASARAARNDYRGVVSALEPRVTAGAAADLASGAFTQMALEMGSALIKLGDRKRAIEMLEGAHAKLPTDEDLGFSLAAAYDQDHRLDQAEHAFRDLVAANPSNAQALNYLGYMLADHGRKLQEAVTFINRALALDTDNASYKDSLGWAYFKLSRYEDARGPLEQAAEALPEVSVIQVHLGDLYSQMKRYDDASAAYDRALAGDRDDLDLAAVTKKRDHARAEAAKSPRKGAVIK